MVAKNRESSHWWWIDSHNKGNSNRSPWLQTTLAELDEKTKRMLRLVEEDADSFAQRAEMYYKKRPELISMVEDFYRTHRSLAERYDLVKSEPGTRLLLSPWSSSDTSPPLPFSKYRLEKSPSLSDKAYDSYSEAYGPEEYDESEVDDPDEEEETQPHCFKSETEEVSSGAVNEVRTRLREEVERVRQENVELTRLREEVERLRQENEEKGGLREEVKRLRKENEELIRLREEVERLRQENMEKEGLREEVERLDEEKQERLRQENEEKRGLREEVERLDEEKRGLRGEVERLRQENEAHRQQLMQKDEEKRGLRGEVERLRQEKEAQRQQLMQKDEEKRGLRGEVERLRQENEAQRQQKDEEKREVIRQLSLAMDLIREENAKLRKCLAKNSPKKEKQLDYNKLKENFFGNLFSGFGKSLNIAL